jgi:hypothetical protein
LSCMARKRLQMRTILDFIAETAGGENLNGKLKL